MATNIPLTGKFRVTCEYKRKGNWACGWHTGIDMVCDNDIIYATCDGQVTKIGVDKSYGNYITIKAPDGKYHWFCHLSKVTCTVGQKVSRTTKIGVMGSTGNSTAKHLHFEIRNASNKYADNSNPADYMGIPNVVGSYDSANYQISANTSSSRIDTTKVFGVKTNIRETPSLSGVAHLYLPNTTVKILEENVANKDGYIWDKVKAIATGRIGYVARTSTRYK